MQQQQPQQEQQPSQDMKTSTVALPGVARKSGVCCSSACNANTTMTCKQDGYMHCRNVAHVFNRYHLVTQCPNRLHSSGDLVPANNTAIVAAFLCSSLLVLTNASNGVIGIILGDGVNASASAAAWVVKEAFRSRPVCTFHCVCHVGPSAGIVVACVDLCGCT